MRVAITNVSETRQLETEEWKHAIRHTDEDFDAFRAMSKKAAETGRKLIISLEEAEGKAHVVNALATTLRNLADRAEELAAELRAAEGEAWPGTEIKAAPVHIPADMQCIPQFPIIGGPQTEVGKLEADGMTEKIAEEAA